MKLRGGEGRFGLTRPETETREENEEEGRDWECIYR